MPMIEGTIAKHQNWGGKRNGSVFSGTDGFIIVNRPDGTAEELARRVDSSVSIALAWDEVMYQGQYTVGEFVLQSVKISGTIKQAAASLDLTRQFLNIESPANGDVSLREIMYFPAVDMVLGLDRTVAPADLVDEHEGYEAILISDAMFTSFDLPMTAATTVFNGVDWNARNLKFISGAGNVDTTAGLGAAATAI